MPVFCLLIYQLQAQTSFAKKLEAAVLLFDNCQTKEQYQTTFSQMEQLYKQDPTAWLPPYYASIIKARMAMKKMGNSDHLADEAIHWLTITKGIHNSDEVLCLESLVYTSKMSVNPTFRWKTYESKIKLPLEQAMVLNKNNPRPFILIANLQYKIPVIFGGGCNSAKPYAQKAKAILDQQKTDFTVMPHWGRPIFAELVKACPL
ncbi:MAG: hypothetical protein ACR2IM_08180 [Sediminibacterium sp.]